MEMRRLVGHNVKSLRQKSDLTQVRLAEVSGFSQQYISGLEQGRRNPTIITIYEIALALGAHYLDLLRPAGRARKVRVGVGTAWARRRYWPRPVRRKHRAHLDFSTSNTCYLDRGLAERNQSPSCANLQYSIGTDVSENYRSHAWCN